MSASILSSLDEAVVVADRVGTVTMLNDSARRFFHIDKQTTMAGLRVADFALQNVDGTLLFAAAHPLARETTFTSGEFRIDHADASRYVCVTRSKVDDAYDDQIGMVVTFHDVTQSRNNAAILRERASHDQLTGLANRQHLTEWLAGLDKTDPSQVVSAFMIELDRFKNVNDIHGHLVGDAVLVEVAARLRSMLRDSEMPARVGGDQFIVALASNSSGPASTFAERIRSELARPFEIGGHRLRLTASVGIAEQSIARQRPDLLVQQADLAARSAKTSGGDRFEFFDRQLRRNVAQLQQRRTLVQQALDNDRLVVHFQPIVDRTDRVIGVEALARCQTPEGEVIAPDGFLDAIIGTNLIVQLDLRALDQACSAAKALTSRNIWVGSNLSAATLAQSDFAQTVLARIDDHKIRPDQICIELTETAAFDATPRTIDDLRILHAAGVRIALDDFGTGYSSLSHLRDLPLSTVKVDRSFTTELDQPGPERAIVAALREVCDSLELLLVVEGVETEQLATAVAELGLHNRQGWAFSPALPLDQIMSMLSGRDGS